MSKVAKITFSNYEQSIFKALNVIGAHKRLPDDGLIIIKPNLTNANKPPVTTPVGAVEAVYKYCRNHSKATIAIGEGCGSGETIESYSANGYVRLAQQYGLLLIDFNREKASLLVRRDTFQLKELYLPEIVLNAFIISLPVLKDHSFTHTTIAMKNMFGLAPAPFYADTWNKSKLHFPSIDKSIVDICLYKKPDLCVVDASVALTGMHLSGIPKNLNVILASFDPVAIDAVGSTLLGHNPKNIDYLLYAHGTLGDMEKIHIVTDH
ncbi:MAG: DUF362 domain-containing protein [bacterium]